MNDLGRFALIWLTVLSLLAFILFAQDKFKARHGRWRISEAALWAVAILGGGVGATVGMRLFHHRRKRAFSTSACPCWLCCRSPWRCGQSWAFPAGRCEARLRPSRRDRSLQAVACSPQP